MTVPIPDDYLVEVTAEGSSLHEYLYIGGPIERPEQNQEILLAIGHAAASWARMEQHLDGILQHINKEAHSGNLNLFDPDHPRPFGAKLRLLKSYFNKHPALSAYRETVQDFICGLKKLAPVRNEIMHSVLENYDSQTRRYTINGVVYQKASNDFRHRRRDAPIENILSFTRLVNLAHYGLCEVSKELFTPDGAAKLRRPSTPIS